MGTAGVADANKSVLRTLASGLVPPLSLCSQRIPSLPNAVVVPAVTPQTDPAMVDAAGGTPCACAICGAVVSEIDAATLVSSVDLLQPSMRFLVFVICLFLRTDNLSSMLFLASQWAARTSSPIGVNDEETEHTCY